LANSIVVICSALQLLSVALHNSIGDAASDLDASILEEFTGKGNRLLIDQNYITVGLKLNLIYLNLPRYLIPARLEPIRVCHLVHFLCTRA
jgi:hypothetical protein